MSDGLVSNDLRKEEAPLLFASGARIDSLGVPLLSGLEIVTRATRVALAGDWSALFRLLGAEATLVSGTLSLVGLPAAQAIQSGAAGLMRFEPALAATLGAAELLQASAELAGLARKAAKDAARGVLERLGLSALTARRPPELPPSARRALWIAHALLTEPRVLCLELPLLGLDGPGQAFVLEVLERAAKGRKLLVALSDPDRNPAERELLARSGEVFALRDGIAVSEPAASAPPTQVTVAVCRNHHAFAAALEARGIRARATHEAGILSALAAPGSGPAWRYLVELGEANTNAILDVALETDAGLLELVPIGS